MQLIDSFTLKRARHSVAYRILRMIAKSALVSMLFFSGSLCSSAFASVYDGSPPDCCHFFSEADTRSLVPEVSHFRSTGRAKPLATARQPIVGIMIQPSSRHWEFDYRVGGNEGTSVMSSLCGFGIEVCRLESLLQQLPNWFELELSLETRAELAIIKRVLLATAPRLIADSILQRSSPLSIRTLRLIEQAW